MIWIDDFWVFMTAGLILNLTPGPDTIYIIGRSVTEGRKAGIFSALGVGTGGLIHVASATLGLSAIFLTSALAFTLLKAVGVVYLVYLGICLLLDDTSALASPVKLSHASGSWVAYRRGVMTNVLNPKVALFFLAFLPQFVDSSTANRSLSYLALGGTFVFTGTGWCLVVAIFSSRASEALRRSRRGTQMLRRVAGAVFLGLAAKLAFAYRR